MNFSKILSAADRVVWYASIISIRVIGYFFHHQACIPSSGLWLTGRFWEWIFQKTLTISRRTKYIPELCLSCNQKYPWKDQWDEKVEWYMQFHRYWIFDKEHHNSGGKIVRESCFHDTENFWLTKYEEIFVLSVVFQEICSLFGTFSEVSIIWKIRNVCELEF